MSFVDKRIIVAVLLCLLCQAKEPVFAGKAANLNALEEKANQGDVESQLNLAGMYRWGQDQGYDVPRDDSKVFYWIQKAADQGIAEAERYVGDAYMNGEGVDRDTDKAVIWYSKAGNHGNLAAQNILGSKFFNDGNFQKAFYWYYKAEQQGDKSALANLEKIASGCRKSTVSDGVEWVCGKK